MNKDETAALARWLWHEVDPGDWSGEVLRPPAEGRGRLVPVAEHERRYAGEREYRGLTVPVSLAGEPAAEYLDAANEGLSTPGSRWAAMLPLLAEFVRTLPAETYATGRKVGVTVFGGNRSVLVLRSGERLTVEGWFKYFSPGEDQGWSQRLERTVRSWTLDAGGPGEVDGDRLARHLIDILKTEKVASMAKLGKHVHGPENAHTVLFGLGF
ncbi:hypothetical protein AB0L53_41195 [Nonomuraea sp. NPDC052129]|uniref:hypothetical protein n=1 Tax=Nonomuraea sp. NPDC052129 TaxID=3154651 RepID=UPI00344712CD